MILENNVLESDQRFKVVIYSTQYYETLRKHKLKNIIAVAENQILWEISKLGKEDLRQGK